MPKKSFFDDFEKIEPPKQRVEATESKPVIEIKIDPEFKALIPPLSDEEYWQLKDNIIAEGIREPICLWQGFIVDGHNRYEIAQEYNLPINTVSLPFKNKEEAEAWIVRNQLGRRNISSVARVLLALTLEPELEAKARDNMSQGLMNSSNPINTRKEIAKIAGVSEDTVAKVKKIKEKASPKVLAKLMRGDPSITINRAYIEIQREEQETPPEIYRVNLKLKSEFKDYVQRAAKAQKMTATEYINKLIENDMKKSMV